MEEGEAALDNLQELEEQNESIDILEQAGIVKPKSKDSMKRFFSPQKFPKDQIVENMAKLNAEQRIFVMQILKRIKTENKPFYYFLSGAAGVGKSTVINAINQLVSHHCDQVRGPNHDSVKVLLTAFSGKAAYIINGTTLHTAFALPFSQFGGELTTLSNDVANTIRTSLIHLELLIIDEISMVGSKILTWVHHRLVEIFGRNEPFGGISVIVVGDLHQLPPVGDRKVFQPFDSPNNNRIGKLLGPVSPLWSVFEYFPLTQVMRQKDDVDFVNALNHLAIGEMTDNDIKLMKSRETNEKDVPVEAIRLYKTNDDVNAYNKKRIHEMAGELIKHTASDSVTGKVTKQMRTNTLRTMRGLNKNKTFGLEYNLDLKIGIRYMVTVNTDIEDGLVNGATGTLRYIHSKFIFSKHFFNLQTHTINDLIIGFQIYRIPN